MAIPPPDHDHVLPAGLHVCSWQEVLEHFAFSNRRQQLCDELHDFVERARDCGFRKIIVWGSFPTQKPEPGDLDLLFVTPPNLDRSRLSVGCAELLLTGDNSRGRFGHDFMNIPDDPEVVISIAAGLGYDNRLGREKGVLVIEL